MENKVIDHFSHRHPLVLTQYVCDKESLNCYGCSNPVTNLDFAYICMQSNCSNFILHKRCSELPSQIWHPRHPQHPLDLYETSSWGWCDLCSRDLGNVFGYRCPSCDFVIDVTCTKLGIDVLLEEKRKLQHPSHPDHPLTLMRKHALAFCCDGCGAQDVDMAYICSTCEFWIHKTCALLPLILPTDRHHHELSLAFSFPMEHRYADFRYVCDICDKNFDTTCWLYYCGDCRFFAHIKCVTFTVEDSNLDEDNNGGPDVIQFPLHVDDIVKELITPFVMREKGLTKIPGVEDMPTTVNMRETKTSFSFLFNYHKHSLSLILDSLEDEENQTQVTDKVEEEEDEDEDESRICEVCVTPILSPPYYVCIDCKYYVHSICYLLPNTLSSSSSSSSSSSLVSPLYGGCPITRNEIHNFTLYTSSELTDRDPYLYECELCKFVSNGMMYECDECKMKIDVKCASLPNSIKHVSHPHHKPLVMTRLSAKDRGRWKKCHGCEATIDIGYCCSSDNCGFALDFKCALLPSSIQKHELDKHPLLLSFDASLDHPTYFICQFCEKELHPKKWMYHCRQCDNSFHLLCPKIASGWYRNVKFGRQFLLDGIHNHALTINHITFQKWCNVCRRNVYNFCGLECASCNYVVCLICAAKKMQFVVDTNSTL